MSLYCSILGPLQVLVDGHDAVIGARKQRLLLALLLCRANAVVPAAELIDALWGETPPRTARKNLQVYVSALRKLTGGRIGFHGWGYRFSAARRARPAALQGIGQSGTRRDPRREAGDGRRAAR
ncbi:winged helix-turn-helix domain-containing protein [Nonomuraea salmonea]|uniref:AfsR/SARP family transcriptional regulator n=1 Tax=Nonomuraea salmonea TaxID=46181 RepID=UPI003605EA90